MAKIHIEALTRQEIDAIRDASLVILRDTGVAGRAIEPFDEWACSNFPRQCVFAPAGADEENVHASIWMQIMAALVYHPEGVRQQTIRVALPQAAGVT